MGLLDDAIREHLELKRRRGADPEEVAREQREVLEPLADRGGAGELDASTEEHPLEEHVAPEDELLGVEGTEQPRAIGDRADTEPAQSEALSTDVPQVTAGHGEGDSQEETAELDMRAVLDDEPLLRPEHSEHAERLEGVSLPREDSSGSGSGPADETPEAVQQTPPNELPHDAPHAAVEMPEQERLQFERGPQGDAAHER